MARSRTSAATASNAAATGWDRRRLLLIVAAAAAVAVLLVGALTHAVYLAISGIGTDEASTDAGVTGISDRDRSDAPRGVVYRDQIAAAEMLQVDADAMFPAEPAADELVGIEIPQGDAPGPAKIQSGFPHNPEGAIGQLAQIDVAVLQVMNRSLAREVYLSWALPGGIGPERWWITRSVEEFLSSSQMGEALDAGAWVEVEPAAALVKGTDGPDWATVCVLLKIKATYRQEAEVAFGHCERMQWTGGRWMIAPGPPPAPAPSTWPGTDDANRAGWRPWTAP